MVLSTTEIMVESSASKAKSAPEPHHNPALDGIRGLAILCVLGHHLVYVNQYAGSPVYVWSRALIDSLWCGVDIFFALLDVYNQTFERALYARGTTRLELIQELCRDGFPVPAPYGGVTA